MNPVEDRASFRVRGATEERSNRLHEAQKRRDAAQDRVRVVGAGPATDSEEDEHEPGYRQAPRGDHEGLMKLDRTTQRNRAT